MRNRHLREWKSSWTEEIKCGCPAAFGASLRSMAGVKHESLQGDMSFSRHGAVE